MKFSAQEEYGLRCLITLGRAYNNKSGLTIPEISQSESISPHNVAKLVRILRINGFLESERGQSGGYMLTKPPKEIKIGEVLTVLGGRLFDREFCEAHAGAADICTNSTDCSVRSLWRIIQTAVDNVVNNLTLNDLLSSEHQLFSKLSYNLKLDVI